LLGKETLMRCPEVPKLVSLRIDGMLSARRAAELDLHLAGCTTCRLTAEHLERAWGALAPLEPAGPAPDDWTAIESAVERERRPWLPAWLQLDFAPTRAATAAILLAMAVVGGAGGLLLGRALPRSRSAPLESQVIAETLGDLPWSSPASGLMPALYSGPGEEARP
jgi:anti-sigma factor RsiW